ncbi:MAG: hypothetical protein Aurels2KO_37600 [Aureliella sp.]
MNALTKQILTTTRQPSRSGMSLLELLACVSILAVLAAALVPRLSGGASHARARACEVQREVIEVQSALWKRKTGKWPASDLSDVSADRSFFPEGALACPVDGEAYKIDAAGKVIGHNH